MSPPQVNTIQKQPEIFVTENEVPLKNSHDLINITSAGVTAEAQQQKQDNSRFCSCWSLLSRRRRIIIIILACVAMMAVVATGVADVVGLNLIPSSRGSTHSDAQIPETGDLRSVPELPCRARRVDGNQEETEIPDGGLLERSICQQCTTWFCRFGKNRVLEAIWFEHSKHSNKVIFVRHGHGSQGEPSIFVLHDFGMHLSAYKNEDDGTCYLAQLKETYLNGFKRWKSYQRKSRHPTTLWIHTDQRIEARSLLHVVGAHIRHHCLNLPIFWAQEIKPDQVTTFMKTVQV